MQQKKWFLLVAFILLIAPFASLSAQDQPTISVALPSMMKSVVENGLFSDFEAANGVKVYVNYTDAGAPPASDDMGAYLDAIADYAAAADVLYVNSNQFSPAVTRAGYLLDLSPLTSADSSLNPDDFVPAAWNSVQWDNGVWALPVTVDITMLIYDPAAFDRAGLAYPDGRWTIDDLANAAKTLTQYDANGSVSTPGLASFGSTADLFRSLYGKNFYDDNGNPIFTDPALEDLLTKWQDMVSNGYVGSSFGGGSFDVPMRLMGSFGLRLPRGSNSVAPVAVALPGGSVGLNVTAFAVSSGTQQPELAYKLANYLTNSASFANSPFGGYAARQSLAGTQTARQNNGGPGGNTAGGGGGRAVFIGGGTSPEAKAALDQLLPDALTLTEQGYADYVNSALSAMTSDSIDAHTALQEEEAQAVTDLQTAADRKSSVSVVVATPPPPVVLAPGKIALNFGSQSFGPQIPNEDRWKQLISDFSASDPDVGNVNLDSDFGNATDYADRDDCFYLGSNAVPSLDETTILNLDPYMDADPNFDPNDVVAGVMAQLQKDNHTWAYPLVIQAQTLSYNAQIFQQAGVPAPDNGWTVSQFSDALTTLKNYLNAEPFVPNDFNGEALMMLIAAYGGLPIDYRTSPATLNFTDPATVSAIQQVLDLAKNGFIKYSQLASTGGSFRIVTVDSNDKTAITTDSLGGFRRFIGGPNARNNPIRLVGFPTGTYNGTSYSITTGYISAKAQNPDACYRWLSYLAQHIDVFGAMPARVSQINDPNMASTLGENVSFYQQFAKLLSDPNTIIFPSARGGNANISDFLIQFWLNRAFDNYVLNNADLNAELSDAQTYATAFQQCVAALPPASTTDSARGPGIIGINSAVRDCANQADSTAGALFPGG
ncbi:MAG: extracellular solute-binding protein [Chloroflexi bacterium]|nr:extracellular solute-binding protein [Chloroflexota bacterium]